MKEFVPESGWIEARVITIMDAMDDSFDGPMDWQRFVEATEELARHAKTLLRLHQGLDL